MYYSPVNETYSLPLDPFKTCMAPRPIGWASTVSREDVDDLAPFSQFQDLSYDPPMVVIVVDQGGDEDTMRRKDAINNIKSMGCFVYNAIPCELKDAMNITASRFGLQKDEFERTGLHKADSVRVATEHMAESPIQFEYEYTQTIRIPGRTAGEKETVDMVIGRVVEIHVLDEIILPDGKLGYKKLRLLGRAGYRDYLAMEDILSMRVPGVSVARMAAMERRHPNENGRDQKRRQGILSFTGIVVGLALLVILRALSGRDLYIPFTLPLQYSDNIDPMFRI